MKKHLVVLCSLLLLVGCGEKKKNENSNSDSNVKSEITSNIDESNSNIESNITSNEESNIVSSSNSNKESVINSNKVSTVASNKTSTVTSNKQSTVTSNKTSTVTSNKSNTVTPDKTGTTSKGYKIERKNNIYYVNGILIANKTYDLPSTYNPGGLLPEFNTAFNKLKSAAAEEGIKIWVQSGFRSYQTQVNLYNRYVARDGKAAADRYSARAGYSEHQTGLAADFNEISDTFGDTKAGKWLANNCWKYGFILRYPKGKENETGYMYESWHFRYIGDTEIAKTLYNNGNWISLEDYLGIDSKYSD